MNSNLPLIFANGFPISMDKITRTQLQTFIPFLLKCSLGHDTTKIVTTPDWWPENIPIITATTKPTCNEKDWLAILKSIILKCYRYHDCEYLVTFCNELTQYHHKNLRYINNFNGTTSLYVKGKGKLLCTFRNENISYDKVDEDSRKCLKPRIVNAIKILDDEEDNEMVTTEAVDIYLCESCNMELESLSDMQEHELICGVHKETNSISDNVIDQDQTNFLNYFKLSSNNVTEKKPAKPSSPLKCLTNTSRRTRGHCDLKRSRNIPFSSPAGKVLLKTANLEIDDEIMHEKLIKLQKMCPAPDINLENPKFMNSNYKNNKAYKVTYKKKPNDYERLYQFPVGHVLSRSKCDEEKYLEKYLEKSNIRTKTSNVEMATHNKKEISEAIIDLCSSDEESSSHSKITLEEGSNSILENILNAASRESAIHKNYNYHEAIAPVSSSINSAPSVCKIAQILYTEKGVMRPCENFAKANTEYIDLCSSDEESILPDLPNYPHLTMIRIPVGSSAML